jgi:pyridoxamine 5'-phosphate oxidase
MTSLGKLVSNLRQEYTLKDLREDTVESDPIKQFEKWFSEAIHCEVKEPNAMTLATANRHGKPSARIVLLKGFDARGFTFFTNYESHKGHDLEENPWAALCFLWLDMERQIRIEGCAERLTAAESDEYYHNRPVGSRLGAWASPQSKLLSREELYRLEDHYRKEFENREISRPPHWGGYRIVPYCIEFWQGRPNRLHDRIIYHWEGDSWSIGRLAP